MSNKAVKSFSEINSYDFLEMMVDSIKHDINERSKEYIIGVDEQEYKKYLIEQFSLEPIEIDFENEHISEPVISKEWFDDRVFGRGKFQKEVYNFDIAYKFSGSHVLFKVQPESWTVVTYDIYVNNEKSIVSFKLKISEKNPDAFNIKKKECINAAFVNLPATNKVAQGWNDRIVLKVNQLFDEQKKKYLQENQFFAAINVKVNKNTESIFTAPTIKKKIIPQPALPDKVEFASVPQMCKEMYDDVLKVIYDSGKSMEKKPSLYHGKDEEGLREQFLFVLETRYEGTTATGETFNRNGKTDILLKYANDGSNLFVAECKFWHGSSEFLNAISQLFDRYLTWRDSKVAVIMFVTNQNFTNVLDTIKSDIKNHPYFIKENGKRGESSFSYIFSLPQDKDKHVFLEVMAFHYDK